MALLECRARGKEVALLTSEPMEEKGKEEPSSQVESKASLSPELLLVKMQGCGAWQMPRADSEAD